MQDIVNAIPRDFNKSLPFVANAVAWTDIFVYQVPSRSKLRLTHFSNYMETDDWGEVTWRILRNGIPVPPYETILDQIGISTLPRMTEPVDYNGGDLCQVQISKTAASVANDIGIALMYEEIG